MVDIPVLFYDGQTSAERNASLSLKSDSWIIECLNTHEFNNTIVWDLSKISAVEIVNNNHVFRYGDFPQQVIVLNDDSAITYLKQYYPSAKFLVDKEFPIKGWKKIAGATLVLITILLSVYFFVLPPVSEMIAEQIPRNLEIDLGGTMLKSFMSDGNENKKLSLLVNQFSKKIDFNTSYPIRVTVAKVDEINAFALPGGNIVIYEGILKKMRSADQLAALLSHEVAHIEYKHSIKSLSRSLAGYVFISLMLNDINGFANVIAENANALKNLSYSRQLETDADYRATLTLAKNRISQQGMVSLLVMLKSQNSHDYPKFLSSHPLTDERIASTKKIAGRQKNISNRDDLKAIWESLEKSIKQN